MTGPQDMDRGTSAPAALPDDAAYREHAELCKVLTDPKRLLLIDALRHAERCAGDLVHQFVADRRAAVPAEPSRR
ncbi:MAG: hypothetical protein M0029_12130 [Actinomycetota bacterium]|nr:hypothetical protein [Actinomycetota bacterium]